MVDFEILYHKMLLASNKALEIIQTAQFECEKMYMEMNKNENDTFKIEYQDFDITGPDTDDYFDIDE